MRQFDISLKRAQLTKEDILENEATGCLGVDLDKLLEVVDFYKKNKDNHWDVYKDYPKIKESFIKYRKNKTLFQRAEISLNEDWRDWLFKYCFEDGFK